MLEDNHKAARENIAADLYDAFMDVTADDSREKDHAAAVKKLEARRAIEKHFEKKALESRLKDYWYDEFDEFDD